MLPDGVAQCQHIAAPHLADDLVTGTEVEHLKWIAVRARLRQAWVLHRFQNPIVEDEPVALLFYVSSTLD